LTILIYIYNKYCQSNKKGKSMTLKTVQEPARQVPDPKVPTYYWLRRSKEAQWKPVLVEPKTETGWPARLMDGIHNPDVSEVSGEWRECPYPED
jgi:hypothetical protein